MSTQIVNSIANSAEWITNLLTLLIFCATTALAWYTARLFRATVRMAKTADEVAKKQAADIIESLRVATDNANATKDIADGIKQQGTMLRAQLRPYVIVESISLGNVADPVVPIIAPLEQNPARLLRPDLGPFAYMILKNYGGTLAKDVVHLANVIVREFPLNNDMPLPEIQRVRPSKMILGAGLVTTKLLRYPNPLTVDEIAGLRQGTMAIYVYGSITYRDDFMREGDEPRKTTFVFFHNEFTGGIGVTTDMSINSEGNEAT